MAEGPTYQVQFRRRRDGKTDYRKRLRMLLSGKPRAVVRRTSSYVIVQVVKYEPKGDRVAVSGHSGELGKYGWKGGTSNTPAAYLTGLLCGLKAVEAGVKSAVFDSGLVTSVKGSKIFAALKGLLDAGMDIPHDKDALPQDARIRGEHIASYASLLGADKKKRFSKTEADPANLPKHFEDVKGNIMKDVKKRGKKDAGK